MGSHQVKSSRPSGRFELQNGYAGDDDFIAHRRSTGRKFDRTEYGRQNQREPREHQVESGMGNDKRQDGGVAGPERVKEKGRLNNREGKKHAVRNISKVSRKSFEDEMVDGWPKWLVDNVPKEALAGLVPKSAESYIMINKVGQGTYSNVYKARDRNTGESVALKKVRLDTSRPECIKFMAREIMILRGLDHPNVVKLKGLATSRMHYSLYLVFDFMQSDLARIVSCPEERLTEPQVKAYMHQLLSGLQHCHDRGILHRDIKGSNLLIDKSGMLKIADFGLANYYNPNHNQPLTSRVVTLWYRAPELLLGATDYGVGIDLWSAGCLLAEMFTGVPIMPGRTEVEQLHRIFRLCGTPSEGYWKKFKAAGTFRPPKSYRPCLVETFKDFPSSSLGLLCTLLALDPAYRGTASKALQNQFFYTSPLACDLSGLPVICVEDEEQDQADEQMKRMNSKIRRSHTLLERRRKSLVSEKPAEATMSSKEESRQNADTYVPLDELGSTTSSTSSSLNRTEAKDSSPIFSPDVSSDQKLLLRTNRDDNGGENIDKFPPLPKSKPRAARGEDAQYRFCPARRSTSARDFRISRQKDRLLLETDDQTAIDDT
ncbi:probable serine/threonine-protein kinase At1g54610 [Prosopis cineraria]|uniref:probable serine/threonine-protein kinase At1g54610 n=1 Tax=Prosopis cineraria TaxID=364024 RepID=UPI00240F015E|nr:probable serine/threonine-protein kinase At1g54610 [Prosopis cineraria]